MFFNWEVSKLHALTPLRPLAYLSEGCVRENQDFPRMIFSHPHPPPPHVLPFSNFWRMAKGLIKQSLSWPSIREGMINTPRGTPFLPTKRGTQGGRWGLIGAQGNLSGGWAPLQPGDKGHSRRIIQCAGGRTRACMRFKAQAKACALATRGRACIRAFCANEAAKSPL